MRIGEEGIIGWVAQHGEPLLVNDVSLEPRYCPDDPRLLPDTHAELAMPLLVEGDVVGVLDVQSTEIGAFGENDTFILGMLADQVAAAVNTARAFEAQREEAWVTTVMLQVAEVTSQADSVEAVLDAAVRVPRCWPAWHRARSGCGTTSIRRFSMGPATACGRPRGWTPIRRSLSVSLRATGQRSTTCAPSNPRW